MSDQYRVGQAYYSPHPRFSVQAKQNGVVTKPFDQWLTESIQPKEARSAQRLSFSQHALTRLQERGIRLADQDMVRLEGAVNKAASKGAKESLVLMDNVAFVVSIVNRKVITAVDQAQMKENVFTNIDSAILV